eukprot:5335728-Alexandrium_andersonii.AAC.1
MDALARQLQAPRWDQEGAHPLSAMLSLVGGLVGVPTQSQGTRKADSRRQQGIREGPRQCLPPSDQLHEAA